MIDAVKLLEGTTRFSALIERTVHECAPDHSIETITVGELRHAAREMEALAREVMALRNLLTEARLQLEYIDERSPSGTTPAVIARINAALGDEQ